MSYQKATSVYKSTSVQNMTPGEQVARLLETAAKHLLRAKEHALANDIPARLAATDDALKIIYGLQSCLDFSSPQTAAMSETLNTYYSTVIHLVTNINVHNDASAADEAVESLRGMASTWREVEKRAVINQ
jgi:flagellar biosynthetic protein FliS